MKYIITLFFLLFFLNVYSQKIIIAEDVVMIRDTQSYFIPLIQQDTTLLRIEKIELQIEELKSQIKELSELLLALILK